MQSDHKTWLKKPSQRLGGLLVQWLLWSMVISLWSYSPLAGQWSSQFELPFLFKFRSWLDAAPEIDERIKTYALDDKTVGYLRRSRLNFDEWARIIEQISTRKPNSIVIDAMFSVNQSTYDSSDHDLMKLTNLLKNSKVPVYVGSFASPQQLPDRRTLSLAAPNYQLKNHLFQMRKSKIPTAENELPLADYRKYFVYGPSEEFEETFAGVGHILSGPLEGNFLPILRISETQILQHLMLAPFRDIKISAGELKVENVPLPVTKDGRAWVNYPQRDALRKNVKSIRSFFSENQVTQTLQSIQEGDYVFIMPMYFTGNVDFKPSPIGLVPGGYTHISILNSILKKQFLHPSEIGPLLTVLCACLASLVGLYLSPLSLTIVWVGLCCIWTLACALVFAYGSHILAWTPPITAWTGICVSLMWQKIREAEARSRFIHQAFDGTVQTKVLNALQSHPERLPLEARERVMTVMFIDIVGFSLIVENQVPRLAFESLKEIMESLSEAVQSHGGIVNKTLGDGLLCFFGYSFVEDREGTDHAEKALQAALEIQRNNVQRMLRKAELGEPIFPLRIGINTSAVFLGNLGTGERLDLTVVGNGVNFTKRLEGACTPHSVLVGPTTKELIEPLLGSAISAKRRSIAIKHHEQKVEAWEYDPFSNHPDLRLQADDAYKNLANLTRLERRWFVPKSKQLTVTALSVSGNLLNFSSTGLSFESTLALARGDFVELIIDSEDGNLRKQLSHLGVLSVRTQIRWSQMEEGRFIYGAKYIDFETTSVELFMEILCQYCSQDLNQKSRQSVS